MRSNLKLISFQIKIKTPRLHDPGHRLGAPGSVAAIFLSIPHLETAGAVQAAWEAVQAV